MEATTTRRLSPAQERMALRIARSAFARSMRISRGRLCDADREDAAADAQAWAWDMTVREIHAGRDPLKIVRGIVRWAAARFYQDRRVGTRQRQGDPLAFGNRHKRIQSVRCYTIADRTIIDHRERHQAEEKLPVDGVVGLVASDRDNPAELATLAVDWQAFLAQHSWRFQLIAARMVMGFTTTEIADEMNVTPGRISQIRREIADGFRAYAE